MRFCAEGVAAADLEEEAATVGTGSRVAFAAPTLADDLAEPDLAEPDFAEPDFAEAAIATPTAANKAIAMIQPAGMDLLGVDGLDTKRSSCDETLKHRSLKIDSD
jgi:hypothetical protein